MTVTRFSLAVLLALATLAPTSGEALPSIQPFSYSASAFCVASPIATPTTTDIRQQVNCDTFSQGFNVRQIGLAEGRLTPELFAFADVLSSTNFGFASTNAVLDYSFKVFGPPNVAVPVIGFVSAIMDFAPQGNGILTASASIDDNGIQRFLAVNNSATSTCTPFNIGPDVESQRCTAGSFRARFTLETLPETERHIHISVAALANLLGGSVDLDPFLIIDPQFPDAGLYTLGFSDGILNLEPTPEPTALLL